MISAWKGPNKHFNLQYSINMKINPYWIHNIYFINFSPLQNLDQFIDKKLSTMIQSAQETLIAKLQQRVKELSSSNEAWKTQALELKKQIVDITVLHKRHERRRTSQCRVSLMLPNAWVYKCRCFELIELNRLE